MTAPEPAPAGPVVLTGATSRIGREVACRLAEDGRPLVLGVRRRRRAEEVREEILARVPGASVDVLPLETGSLPSVLDFAAAYADRFAPWTALVHGAAVVLAPTRRLTPDGFELHLGVNHLARYALTGLLLPFAAPRARVVSVTSLAARAGHLLFHDLRFDHGYRPFRAYAASMRATWLFSRELARRSPAEGFDVVSVAAHPGYAVPADRLRGALGLPVRALAQDYRAAAAPTVYAVTAPGLTGGELVAPSGRTRTAGAPGVVPPLPVRDEEQVAARLWRFSGQLTRIPW